jgi:hypothetical protein
MFRWSTSASAARNHHNKQCGKARAHHFGVPDEGDGHAEAALHSPTVAGAAHVARLHQPHLCEQILHLLQSRGRGESRPHEQKKKKKKRKQKKSTLFLTISLATNHKGLETNVAYINSRRQKTP